MANVNPLNPTSPPNYSIDNILQSTKPLSSGGGGFRRVLGGLLGSVGNMFAPGMGGMIGSLIGGSSGGGLMGSDPMQYIQLQQQMNMEQRYYETMSACMKSKHDASMAAIRNIQ